jgi:ATP-dependent DNA helicase DinG
MQDLKLVGRHDSADDFDKEPPSLAKEYRDMIADMKDTYVNDTLKEDGHLSKELDGWQARVGQIDMSEAVHKTFHEHVRLLVEAPTGTGKSMAYAIPACWHTVVMGGRAFIVTSNITLQEQLMEKDLPLLQERRAR